MQENLVRTFLNNAKKSNANFLKLQVFFGRFCNKCAEIFKKIFASCKYFNYILIIYAKFLGKILLDATFSMIFKKVAKTELNFFMQMQKSKILFLKNLLIYC